MWKLTNAMAAPMAGVVLRAPKDAVLIFALSFLIAVTGQESSSSTYPVNATETFSNADNFTASLNDSYSEYTFNESSIWPTASSSAFVEQTLYVPENKSMDTPTKEGVSKAGVDNSIRLQPNTSLESSTQPINSESSSVVYKMESVYKTETETSSKMSATIQRTSVYSRESVSLMPYPTQGVLLETSSVNLVSTPMYDSLESSSQYQIITEHYTSMETPSLQQSKSLTDSLQSEPLTLYTSIRYVTPSSEEMESSSFTKELPIYYPGQSNFSSDVLSSSYSSISEPPVISLTASVLPTEILGSLMSDFTISQSSERNQTLFSTLEATITTPSATIASVYSSEPVIDSLFSSDNPDSSLSSQYSLSINSSYPTPSLTTSLSESFTWSDYSFSEIQYHNSSSSIVHQLPSADLSETLAPSIEVTPTDWLFPTPETSSFEAPETVGETSTEIHSALHMPTWVTNVTVYPTDESSHPVTEESRISPTTTVPDYWEIPSTWWEYPTESYFSSEDYYSDESPMSQFVHRHTEFLPDFGTTSSEHITTTIDFFETPESAVSEDISPTDAFSEIISPEKSTDEAMSSSVKTTYPYPTSSLVMPVTTEEYRPEYMDQKFIITFNGDCQALVSDVRKIREFQSKVKVIILNHLEIEENSVYMDRVACGSVKSYVVIYNTTQNYSAALNELVSSGSFLVEMEFPETNSTQIYRAYKVEEVAVFEPVPKEPDLQSDKLSDKDIALIILACVICAVLVIIGIVVCARRMYSKKYAQSFNLMDTRHSNLKMDDYTLTQFPLPRRSYGEDGVRVQSYHSNGQTLLPPLQHYNHNHSSDMDSTLERSVDVGDIRLEGSKPSSFGTNTRKFDYTPNGNRLDKSDTDCPLPSTSMDSSSSAHDRSTENLVPGLNGSTLHGSVNPIYSGDDTEGTASVSSDPPPYTDDTSVNM